MNQEERDIRSNTLNRIQKLLDNLDMYGKRWMFIKIYFPTALPSLSMEGSCQTFFLSLIPYCETRDLLSKLEEELNEVFGE